MNKCGQYKKYLLEACVDSVESALNAVRGGADRLELCSNLIIGGTTPSQGLFMEIRKHCNIKIHCLIRPRFGDFCYSSHELEIIRRDLKMFRELGADGVVIGILRPDGTLAMEPMAELIELAGDMSITLHRAFDLCNDPLAALDQAKALGIHTILTSGQQNTCLEGIDLLRTLVEQSEDKIDILVAGGVSADVIEQIHRATHATCYHMSGKATKESTMLYRREGISMGLPSFSEYEIWQTNEKSIREARKILDSFK